MATPQADAGSPRLNRVTPAGLTKGTEREIKLIGTSLADAREVLFKDSRLKAVIVKKDNARECVIKVTADAALPPNQYEFWLGTETGISNMRLLSVGALPTVAEVEPNTDFDQAQEIAFNHTVEGIVNREDLDHYRIQLAEGQTINLEIEALRLHYTLNNQNIFDPYISILDANRFEVASCDDSSLWQQDGLLTFTPETAGQYTILVRDSSFNGHGGADYRLHVGNFPRPLSIQPSGGKPGQKFSAQAVNIDGTKIPVEVDIPADASGPFPVHVTTESGVSTSPNQIIVSPSDLVRESEPNNGFDDCNSMTVPGAFEGVLEVDHDYDVVKIPAKKGTKYRVRVIAREVLRSKGDLYVQVFKPDRKYLTQSDDVNAKPDPYVEFTAPVDGDHFVRVFDHLRSGSSLHRYRIEIEAAKPEVKLTAKELRRDEPWNTVVPAGGYGVMMVTAARKDYGGAIDVAIDDSTPLPEGVSVVPYQIPAGRIEMPLVFKATPEAPMAAKFIALKSPSDQFASSFHQTQKLVLGQNRRPLWNRSTDYGVVTVRKKLPFSIEVDAPKTPIVRQGNKEIVMRIQRDEGFTADVSIRTAYNPPGVGVNNGKRFRGEEKEIRIPISANGGAAPGNWPMVFVARYGEAAGPVEVGTMPVSLTVETQYFKFEFPKAAGELGTETQYAVGVEVLRDLPAEAEVQIAGLPKGVTCNAPIQPIKKGDTQVTFPIQIAADAKVGNHKTIVAIGRVKLNGEPIQQTVGTGAIRVDKPLPPKANAKPAAPKPAAKPKPKSKPTAKPLSRLEQLRQQKKGNQ